MNAVELSALADSLERGEAVPADHAAELAAAIRVTLDGGDALDRALGLRSRGGISPAREVALSKRDAALRRLWRTSPEWRDLSASAAARFMVQSARRCENTRWPRERDDVAAPGAEPAATFCSILASNAPMPGTKRLAQILETEIQ